MTNLCYNFWFNKWDYQCPWCWCSNKKPEWPYWKQ